MKSCVKDAQITQQPISSSAEMMREPYALTLSRAEDALSSVSAHILISCKPSAVEAWKVRCEIAAADQKYRSIKCAAERTIWRQRTSALSPVALSHLGRLIPC